MGVGQLGNPFRTKHTFILPTAKVSAFPSEVWWGPLDPPSEETVDDASVLDAAHRCPLCQLGNLFISERVQRGGSSTPWGAEKLHVSSPSCILETQSLKKSGPCSQGAGRGMQARYVE